MEADYASNLIRLRPEVTEEQKYELQACIKKLEVKDCLVLASSGSTQNLKFLIIPQAHMLAHGELINDLFPSEKPPRWLMALPPFYMGGVAIHYRCRASGAKLVSQKKWDPREFIRLCQQHRVTHTSLVPSQLFDVVQLKTPLPSLEHLFIGGDALHEDLYQQGRALGLPLRCSYGLSELCSQVATAFDGPRPLPLLPFIQARVVDDLLQIQSDFHFKYQLIFGRTCAPTVMPYEDFLSQGYFKTHDRASLTGEQLTLWGRDDDQVKIDGKFHSLVEIESRLLHHLPHLNPNQLVVLAGPHPKRGQQLYLLTTEPLTEALQRYLDLHFISYREGRVQWTGSGKKIRRFASYSAGLPPSISTL